MKRAARVTAGERDHRCNEALTIAREEPMAAPLEAGEAVPSLAAVKTSCRARVRAPQQSLPLAVAWRRSPSDNIACAFDTDPKQGIETRIKVTDMLAAQRMPVLVYHLPWPGVGHFAKQGDGFRYVAEPMQFVL
jgi:hypothetical protein